MSNRTRRSHVSRILSSDDALISISEIVQNGYLDEKVQEANLRANGNLSPQAERCRRG
jgi:hypothetical protein